MRPRQFERKIEGSVDPNEGSRRKTAVLVVRRSNDRTPRTGDCSDSQTELYIGWSYSAGSAHNAQVERREDVDLCKEQLNNIGRGCWLGKERRSAPLLHAFYYIYANRVSWVGNYALKSNVCLMQIFGQFWRQSQRLMKIW